VPLINFVDMENNTVNKSCILVGGGYSVKTGINTGLWEKIKGKDVWSLNFAYLAMPYLPSRQVWVDISFFNNNIDSLQKLNQQGVSMHAKLHSRYSIIKEIKTYGTTREKRYYTGKEGIEKNVLYLGRMGSVGIFALSLAIAEGYKNIYLLGYDFGMIDPKANKTHFYEGELKVISSGVGRPQIYLNKNVHVRREVEDFDVFKKEEDVNIYNVSPNSRITSFPKITYEEFYGKVKDVQM